MAFDDDIVTFARRQREAQGSLYIGNDRRGQGFGLAQGPDGRRRATQAVDGRQETFTRPAAPTRFDLTTTAGGIDYGRDLRPGEFEVERRVPRLVQDMDGDGIPDGARVTVTQDRPGGMRMAAKFVKGMGRDAPPPSMEFGGTAATGGSRVEVPSIVRGDPALTLSRAIGLQPGAGGAGQEQDWKQMAGFGSADDVAADVRQRSMALDRNTRDGMTALQRLDAENHEAERRGQALALADRQFVRPAEEATKRAELVTAGRERVETGKQEVERGRTAAQERVAQARMAEAARQFNEKNKGAGQLRFETDSETGARIAVLGNVMMRAEETPRGFFVLRGEDGRPKLVMNEAGDVVTFNPVDGAPVIVSRAAFGETASSSPWDLRAGVDGAASRARDAATLESVRRAPVSPGAIRARGGLPTPAGKTDKPVPERSEYDAKNWPWYRIPRRLSGV